MGRRGLVSRRQYFAILWQKYVKVIPLSSSERSTMLNQVATLGESAQVLWGLWPESTVISGDLKHRVLLPPPFYEGNNKWSPNQVLRKIRIRPQIYPVTDFSTEIFWFHTSLSVSQYLQVLDLHRKSYHRANKDDLIPFHPFHHCQHSKWRSQKGFGGGDMGKLVAANNLNST